MSSTYQVKMQRVIAAAVGSQVGNRIYLLRARQGSVTPYVIHRTVTHTLVGHLRGSSNLENPRVRVELFGPDYDQLKAMETSIRNALLAAADFTAVYIFSTEVPEDETDLFHLVSEYSVWHG